MYILTNDIQDFYLYFSDLLFKKKNKNLNKPFNYLISPELSEFKKFSPKLKIAVLASGEGSNFQELINLSNSNCFDIDIKILITNKNNAGCISRAVKSGIPFKIIKESNYIDKKFFEEEIIKIIKSNDIELVVMAGWMKIVSNNFVNSFKKRIINIHPSLLPSYKGKNAINDAIANGSKITGCSVHFVEEDVDSGSLIMQAAFSILDDDSVETITNKIHILEHKILPLSISHAGYLIRKNFKGND